MELRNHPLMSHYGIPNWHPVWIPANPRDDKPSLQGEIGVLKYVLCQRSGNACFLMMAYDGMGYIGSLHFDEGLFCQQIGKSLTTCTGRTIKEMGDLDLFNFFKLTVLILRFPKTHVQEPCIAAKRL